MRLASVNIPDRKHIYISLTYIHGIGVKSAKDICRAAGINENTITQNLNSDDITRISSVIADKYTVEGELRKRVSMNIKLLIEIGAYRGRRHYNKLPVRGQKTHSNARTRKGRARAPIAGKKK